MAMTKSASGWTKSVRLDDVLFEVRGLVLAEAKRLKAQGHRIIDLHDASPAVFGLEAPQPIQRDMVRHLPNAQGYSEAKGILSARHAVVQHYERRGLFEFDADYVYLGNGVSELIIIAISGLLNQGDEVLIPEPDYPLWTAAVKLSGGRPVYYKCDEDAGWAPDLGDVEAKVTASTVAIVIINPNNPTGAVYSHETLKGMIGTASRNGLIVYADEIYDKILYDENSHIFAAAIDPDVLVVTFSGLSKSHRVAGYRSGWMAISGPVQDALDYVAGIDMLANLRLSPNVPAQHAIQPALAGYQSMAELVAPDGRLTRQREAAHRQLTSIPGISCTKAPGAMYLFPKLDIGMFDIESDEDMVLALLREEQVLVAHGSGFNLSSADHFRIVTLPMEDILSEGLGRLERFLERRSLS